MSRPPLEPQQTLSGIAVDPQTLNRVIPESRRPDGSIRKQIKIRPGFTPQEDVRHIVGWAPPPTSTPVSTTKPLSKSAKKNAKRKEKREKDKSETQPVPDSWEDDDVEPTTSGASDVPKSENQKDVNPAAATKVDDTNSLSSKLEKLEVR